MKIAYSLAVSFLAHLVVSAALLVLVSNAVRGFHVSGALPAIIAALVLGLVNAVVWPVAVVLTFPLTVITLGLFLLVLNALMLKLVAALVPGFRIRGFLPAVWGGILLAILNLLVEQVAGPGW